MAIADVLARATEGFIETPEGKVWYQTVGEGEPLLLLHGGPGATSTYLEALMALADDGFQVVRYDQLGSGKSEQPDDTSLWTVDHFVNEVDVVRAALGFEQMHLLGQSWGSFLALEYALRYPRHVQTMTLYSGAASTEQCFEGMNSLRFQLPPDVVDTMARYEAAEDFENPEYLAAVQILLDRHLCRVQPWPDELTRSMENMGAAVYNTMWGPNEFTLTGNLATWDRRDRLDEIDIPTLIVCGRYDEVIPACSETMHAGIKGSRLYVFENSSHLCHMEEPGLFFPLFTGFLKEHPIG
ncbi:MAG TPA: proline iminopeptidase-family hydrolase [Thermomicrobiales bacterium]|nr:proline iminopeptidase-family hydrolase [Thermomicrobiales bacterium]